MKICRKVSMAICLIICVILLSALSAGCRRGSSIGAVDHTDAPDATASPDVAYDLTHVIRYWPEDADYDSCDYAAITQIPQFSTAYTAGYGMNELVHGYLDELYNRVEKQYMAISVAEPPYTEVTCVVEYIGAYTQVVFTEEHCYEAQPTYSTYVLVMDERGSRVDMNQVFNTYHAEEYIANSVYNTLMQNSSYYHDKTITEVRALLSVKNGCRLTESGCIAYLKEGVFAPYEYGELAIEVARGAMYPQDIVGGGAALTQEEFDKIRLYSGFAASAIIVREQNIVDGTLTPYAATGFMGDVVLNMGLISKAGRVTLSKSTFEELYFDFFGTDFPGIDTDGHDIAFENNAYSISVKQQPYMYRFDITGAVRQGEALTITGDVVFGDYSYAYTTYICHATLLLAPMPDSLFGYKITTFELGL